MLTKVAHLLTICFIIFFKETGTSNREKRDNGAAFENFGGPVAMSSGPADDEEGGGGGDQGTPPVTTPKPNLQALPEFDERRCIHLVPVDEAQKQFDTFIIDFNRTYTEAERKVGFETFRDSLQVIQKMTCGAKGNANMGSFAVTDYSDMSYHDFIATQGGASFDLTEKHLDFKGTLPGNLKKCPRVDWREEGVIPEPRKQGKCGACYAFSTSDLIAAQFQIDRKTKKDNFKLAPQYFVDCMKTPAGLGCGGGRPIELLRNMSVCTAIEGCNIPTEECYPYTGKQGTCKIEACQRVPKIAVRWGGIIDATGVDEMERIASLLQWGPAVVIIDADQSWQFYKGSILHSSQCGKKQNHAVLLVGYDYTGPVPFYIVKNSWGTKWGEGGFIRLEAGKNTCSIAKSLTFCCTQNCEKISKPKDLAERPNWKKCAAQF